MEELRVRHAQRVRHAAPLRGRCGRARALALRWQREFWGLLFPTACVICGAADWSLCPACRARLYRATRRPLRAEMGAEALPEREDGPLPVVAAGTYRDVLSRAVLAYKDHGHTELRPVLAAALARALQQGMDEPVPGRARTSLVPRAPGPIRRGTDRTGSDILIIAVPSSARARRRRGYEPVQSMLGRLERWELLPRGAAAVQVLEIAPSGFGRMRTDADGLRAHGFPVNQRPDTGPCRTRSEDVGKAPATAECPQYDAGAAPLPFPAGRNPVPDRGRCADHRSHRGRSCAGTGGGRRRDRGGSRPGRDRRSG